VSGGGHILTCWARPWDTRRRAGGVTEQACQVIQNASPSQSLFIETVFISVKQSFLAVAYRNSGRPTVPRRRVWAYRGNYWTTPATNQHAQWAMTLCNWLTTHTVSLTVDCWLIDSKCNAKSINNCHAASSLLSCNRQRYFFSIGSIPILQVSARYRYPIPISF